MHISICLFDLLKFLAILNAYKYQVKIFSHRIVIVNIIDYLSKEEMVLYYIGAMCVEHLYHFQSTKYNILERKSEKRKNLRDSICIEMLLHVLFGFHHTISQLLKITDDELQTDKIINSQKGYSHSCSFDPPGCKELKLVDITIGSNSMSSFESSSLCVISIASILCWRCMSKIKLLLIIL